MRHPRAGLQRTEEIDWMIRRVAEEEGNGRALAIAGAEERGGRDFDHRFQPGVGDRAIAEFDHCACAIGLRGFRQQAMHRAFRDLIIPMHAVGIKLLAGMGHQRFAIRGITATSCKLSTTGRAPLPLAGRGGGRGYHAHRTRGLPPSLPLPRKGGGNGESVPPVTERSRPNTITPLSTTLLTT